MPLHIIKLCVGCESIADLEGWIAQEEAIAKKRGKSFEQIHVTRMMPKKVDDILDGGSLYWVIKGQVACRQAILDLKQFTDRDGISRCAIHLGMPVVPVAPRPYRAFQGWRYLESKDAPPDLGRSGKGTTEMPESLRRELAELGLL